MNKKLIAAAFFILFMASTGAEAEINPGSIKVSARPSPEAGPTKVETGIWFLDINSINSAEQTFSANVFISLTWKDPSLAHSGTGEVKYPLNKIWTPAFQIINESLKVRRTLPETASVQSDGMVEYDQRYVGVFLQPLNLKDFPFDKHKFRLRFIAPKYTPEDVQFVPRKIWVDRGLPYSAGMSEDLSLPDWEILDFKVENSPFVILKGYERAGYTFEFTARRLVKYYLIKIILPLIFIVMMSWVVFWIDPENANAQISASITSMLTLIAYRFAIGSQVPKVSYTTRMDAFIFMSTLLVFIALVQVMVTSTLAKCNKGILAKKIDRISRIVFPVVFFPATFFTLFR